MKNMNCPSCLHDVHWYEGHPELDTYLAYSCDQNGSALEEVELLPRMDRVDEVKDDRFYMCSNGDCMMVWEEENEISILLKYQKIMKKCTKCNEVFRDSDFCENCGIQLVNIDSDVLECKSCQKYFSDSLFCCDCGQKLAIYKAFKAQAKQSATVRTDGLGNMENENNRTSSNLDSIEISKDLDAQSLFKELVAALPEFEYLVFTWSGGGDSFGGFDLVQSKVNGKEVTSHDQTLISKIKEALDSSSILFDMDLSVNTVDQGWSEGLLLIALQPLSDYFYYEDQVYMEEEEGFKGYSINGRNHEDIGGYIEV